MILKKNWENILVKIPIEKNNIDWDINNVCWVIDWDRNWFWYIVDMSYKWKDNEVTNIFLHTDYSMKRFIEFCNNSWLKIYRYNTIY